LFWSLNQCLGSEVFTGNVRNGWIKVYSKMLSIMVPVAVAYELAGKSVKQKKRLADGKNDVVESKSVDPPVKKNYLNSSDVFSLKTTSNSSVESATSKLFSFVKKKKIDHTKHVVVKDT
jgi:hypothetical protein